MASLGVTGVANGVIVALNSGLVVAPLVLTGAPLPCPGAAVIAGGARAGRAPLVG